MKFLNSLLKIIAFVMMFFVVIALPLTLVARDIGSVVYNPDIIEAVAKEHLLRIDLMAVILQGAVTGAIAEGSSDDPMSAITVEAFSNMESEDWVELARMVMPPQIVSGMLNEILTGVYGWIDSPDPVLNIKVNIRDIKRIWIQKAVPATELVLKALPQCSADQLAEIPRNWPDGGETLPACRPTEPTYSRVVESVVSILPEFLAEVPNEISFSDSGDAQVEELRQNQIFFRRNRFMARVGWVIVIVIYFVAIAAGARSWKGVFSWAGWPLLLSGVIMLVLGIIWSELADDVFVRIRNNYLADTPRVLVPPITGMLRTLAELMTDPFWGQGFVLIIFGITSIGVAIVLGRISKPTKPETRPPIAELQPDDLTPAFPTEGMETPSQTHPSPPKWGQTESEEDDESPSGMFG